MQKANLKTGDKKAMHGKIFRKANILTAWYANTRKKLALGGKKLPYYRRINIYPNTLNVP